MAAFGIFEFLRIPFTLKNAAQSLWTQFSKVWAICSRFEKNSQSPFQILNQFQRVLNLILNIDVICRFLMYILGMNSVHL